MKDSSTRNKKVVVSGAEAIEEGLSPEGGCVMSERSFKPPIPLKKQIWLLLAPVFCVFGLFACFAVNLFRLEKRRKKQRETKDKVFLIVFLIGIGLFIATGVIMFLVLAVRDLSQKSPANGILVWFCFCELVALSGSGVFLLTQEINFDIGWHGLRVSKRQKKKHNKEDSL